MVSWGPMNWYSAQEVNISLANTTFIISSNIKWYVTTILFFNNYQFCWNNGGYLAEFFSSKEEARVEDILATDLDYWIGLTDRQTEGMKRKGKIKPTRFSGVWKWQESRTEAEYVNWGHGEPNNYRGNEDCVHKGNEDYGRLWNDRPCDNDSHALCQAPK